MPGTQILMCIHETRRSDYAAYIAEHPGSDDATWKNASEDGVPASDSGDHPVVSVTWENAQDFSRWLSQKEGRRYRLPTDREWSLAVGLGEEPGSTFEEKEKANRTSAFLYPWGRQWPPPKGAGNFADIATARKFPLHGIINGYEDGYATTAPVMSFKPNQLGIYDLAGNVIEWCEDLYNEEEGPL